MQQSRSGLPHIVRDRSTRSASSVWKRQLSYWLAGLALLLLFTSCSGANTPSKSSRSATSTPSSSGDEIRQFPNTWNNIHLFLTFDYNISDPAAIARHYDFVWGAKPDHVAAFRSANPDIFLTYYISFFRDTGTFFDSQPRSLSYWKTTHPDWILYQCDRVTPAYAFGDSNIPLDFANPAVVQWQVQTYAQPASMSGYNGIAADNVNLQNASGACGVYKNGQWVQLYSGQPNDPKWKANVIEWLARMQQALHSLKHPLALISNLTLGSLAPDDPLLQQVLSHIDGVLDEDGFTEAGDAYLTGTDWIQTIQFIQSVQAQHKAYYIINQFSSSVVDSAEVQWAVASYLMAKGHSSALFISTVQGYGSDFWDPIYNAQIGSPSGSMYQMQGIYARNYSGGLSLVNPSAAISYTVSLPSGHHYVDLYGMAVSGTITMPPHSGLVLLTSS